MLLGGAACARPLHPLPNLPDIHKFTNETQLPLQVDLLVALDGELGLWRRCCRRQT